MPHVISKCRDDTLATNPLGTQRLSPKSFNGFL